MSHIDKEELVKSITGSMAISGMELTEEDKERIRLVADDPEKVDEVVKALAKKHRRAAAKSLFGILPADAGEEPKGK